MKEYRVAVIPGDNIGPEVTAEGLKCLDLIQELGYCRFSFETYPWGAGYYVENGRAAPEDIAELLSAFDAIYFGAHGDPARVPDGIASQQLMSPLRKGLDLYVNIRPVRSFAGVASPLKSLLPIDLVVVRENAEGEYANVGGRLYRGTPHEMGIQTSVVTRRGAERIMRFAFDLARKRNSKKSVHCVTKSNALPHTMALWDDVFAQLSSEYPDVSTTKSHFDAMSMYLITRPESFDVVVATNLMGDVISDEAAAVCGGIGLVASGNINPDGKQGMFEPIHGSAPDIAGQGIANPIAAILAAGMMLNWLGEQGAARALEAAVMSVLAQMTVRTPDLAGTARTREMTAAILSQLRHTPVASAYPSPLP